MLLSPLGFPCMMKDGAWRSLRLFRKVKGLFDFSLIHYFTYDDLNLVLDVNSGSLHALDDLGMAYLAALEASGDVEEAKAAVAAEHGPEEAEAIASAIDELIAEGLLFSPADFSDYAPSKEHHVKALCLHMAHDCNLRCGYCFADGGAYHGPRGLMSREDGEAAMDFLLEASGQRKHVEVDFFGGEPLLNRELCVHLTDYGTQKAEAMGKTLKCTLTTNGVLLDDATIDWLNEKGLDVVLSLDGREEVHDRMRPFAGGGGSYAQVLPGFQKLANSRDQKNYYLRGTYSRYNKDFAEDVIHMADELGFEEISMEPVVAPADKDYALREEDKAELMEQYDRICRHMKARREAGKPYRFFHFNIDLDGGPCLPKRLSGCGAGHDYLAVSPEGDLYPCHQFVGEEAYKIGDVFNGIEKPEIGQAFKEADVRSKDICMDCWARFFCSGGCHANNIRYGAGLDAPYAFGCDLQRKRLECALYLKATELLEAMEDEEAV